MCTIQVGQTELQKAIESKLRDHKVSDVFLDTIQDPKNKDISDIQLSLKTTDVDMLENIVCNMLSSCYERNITLDRVTDNYDPVYDSTESNQEWKFTINRTTDDDGDIINYHFRFICDNNKYCVSMSCDSY